jgi:hypothetical protein
MGLRTCYTPWGAYVRVHREGRSKSSPRDAEMDIRHDSGLPSARLPRTPKPPPLAMDPGCVYTSADDKLNYHAGWAEQSGPRQ